jgi:hypothetical protein
LLNNSFNDVNKTITDLIAIINVTTKQTVAEIEDEYFASNSQYLVTYNKVTYSLKIFKIKNGQVIYN